MDETNINVEELRKALLETFKTYTVEEALEDKKEEEKMMAESFESVWNSYNSVTDVRKIAIKNLKEAKFKIILARFLASIISNNNMDEELDNLMNIIRESTKELNGQKELLYKIRIAIEKLQMHDVAICNYELSELLACLFEKDAILLKKAIDEMGRSSIRLRGISTMYDDSHDVKLEELNGKIEEQLLILGLNK